MRVFVSHIVYAAASAARRDRVSWREGVSLMDLTVYYGVVIRHAALMSSRSSCLLCLCVLFADRLRREHYGISGGTCVALVFGVMVLATSGLGLGVVCCSADLRIASRMRACVRGRKVSRCNWHRWHTKSMLCACILCG